MQIETLIAEWGFIGVFAAAVIEEVAFVIPSSVVQLAAGFVILGGDVVSPAAFLTLAFAVALPIALGTVTGSFFLYGVGYWLGKPFIDRFGRYLGVSWESIDRIVSYARTKRSDELLLLGARLIPIIPNTPLGIACGTIRYSLVRYTLVSFVGIYIRAFAIGYVGWRVGTAYEAYAQSIEAYKYHGLAILVLSVGLFVWYALKRRRKRV